MKKGKTFVTPTLIGIPVYELEQILIKEFYLGIYTYFTELAG